MGRLHDLVADTVSNRLFRAMRVTEVSDLGPFREISLTSVASWTPGDKIQLRVARDGLTMRTYTPVRWDDTTGDTTILSYLHGAGLRLGPKRCGRRHRPGRRSSPVDRPEEIHQRSDFRRRRDVSRSSRGVDGRSLEPPSRARHLRGGRRQSDCTACTRTGTHARHARGDKRSPSGAR
jgi:hypothetical protein